MPEPDFSQPPQLHEFVGNKVIAIAMEDDEEWQWSILLEGPVVIRNYDVKLQRPEAEIIGQQLMSVSLSMRSTVLHFSKSHVWLTPTQYSISVGDQPERYPQRTPELENVPNVYATPEQQKDETFKEEDAAFWRDQNERDAATADRDRALLDDESTSKD